jgi:hypothetical protein
MLPWTVSRSWMWPRKFCLRMWPRAIFRSLVCPRAIFISHICYKF